MAQLWLFLLKLGHSCRYICSMNSIGSTVPDFDLGFNKPRSATRVVVAMSGGVDSSVTAALLKEAGYDVVGVTLQLYDHGVALQKKGACCAGADIYDARMVAEKINIPHYVLDYESVFQQQVMEDFADSYMRGETPIPCVRCNQKVKFRDLLDTAKQLDADCMATGHYARRVMGAAGAELHRAAEDARDQSYFLFTTTRAQLDYIRFPLGGLPKSYARAEAARLGLVVADKPDSQDICFVPTGNYAEVVSRMRPGALTAGDIVHIETGKVVGRHEGIINFTIGQRRGLGVGGEAEPLYVVGLDAAQHKVLVGPKTALARTQVFIKELNWLGDGAAPATNIEVQVKLRSAQPLLPATLSMLGDDRAMLQLHAEHNAVATGQAAVIYDGARVLGGGWIMGSAA